MDGAYCRALAELRVQLLRDLRCENHVVEHLSLTKVLADEQRRYVIQAVSSEEQTRRLLDILPKLEDCAWVELLRGLRNSGSDTHCKLADNLEKLVKAPMALPGDSSLTASGSSLANVDEQECSYAAPNPLPLSWQAGMESYERLPMPHVTYACQHYAAHHDATVQNRMTTSTYLPRGHEQTNAGFSHQGQVFATSLPVRQPYAPTSPFTPQPVRIEMQHRLPHFSQTGIDFRELSPQELGGLADQLESRISVHLPHFTRILLGSLPRFHSGGTGALKRFQRENAIDSEVLALLRLWISEPNIACTGLAFYEALRQVGDGLAASCQNLLWPPAR